MHEWYGVHGMVCTNGMVCSVHNARRGIYGDIHVDIHMFLFFCFLYVFYGDIRYVRAPCECIAALSGVRFWHCVEVFSVLLGPLDVGGR